MVKTRRDSWYGHAQRRMEKVGESHSRSRVGYFIYFLIEAILFLSCGSCLLLNRYSASVAFFSPLRLCSDDQMQSSYPSLTVVIVGLCPLIVQFSCGSTYIIDIHAHITSNEMNVPARRQSTLFLSGPFGLHQLGSRISTNSDSPFGCGVALLTSCTSSVLFRYRVTS